MLEAQVFLSHIPMMQNESFYYRAPSQRSPLLITADHATNIVPHWVNGGSLGISDADMNRHIAYDIGTMGLAQEMAEQFDAHFLASQYSRLVVDPNRGEDDPTLLMQIYDRSIIPANRNISAQELEARMDRLYRPYHEKLDEVLAEIKAGGIEPIILSIHSFTPQLKGRDLRPWQVGVLSADDRRLADPLIAAFEAEGDLVVGDNEPYRGALKGDSMDRHGIHQGHLHALLEIRNDLIETKDQQRDWGGRIVRILRAVFESEGISYG